MSIILLTQTNDKKILINTKMIRFAEYIKNSMAGEIVLEIGETRITNYPIENDGITDRYTMVKETPEEIYSIIKKEKGENNEA